MRRALHRLRREDGLTLTELLVVIPLLSIVLAAIAGTLVTLSSGNSSTGQQLTQQSTFFPILDSMVQDLRTAMPPTLGGLPVITATSTEIVFYSPDMVAATSGATSPFHLREMAYQFSGGALQRQSVTSTNTYSTVTSTSQWGTWTSASGSFPLASFPSSSGWTTILGGGFSTDGKIASASFTYYDGNEDALSTPLSATELADLRTIQISVTVADGSHQTTYTNTATIRETQPTQ